MKVRMLTNTNYRGFRKVNDEFDVPEEVAVRWINKNIAVEVEELMEVGTSFDKMSVKQLYKMCIEQGLDVQPKKSKEYYIDELSALSDDEVEKIEE